MSGNNGLTMAEQAKAIRKCLLYAEAIPIELEPMMERLKLVGMDVLETPNMPATLQTVIDLEAILFYGHRPRYGICSGLQNRVIFGRVAQEWPEHSGNFTYPVPHELGAMEVYDAIRGEPCNPKMWTGSYGEARLRLAAFVHGELIRRHPWLGEVYDHDCV